MADLTVRQLVVLQIVVDHGPLSTRAVMDHVRDRCPCPCGQQGGFMAHVPEDTCRRCHGWGHAPFTMSDSYRTLTQLQRRGKVTREKEESDSDTLVWDASISSLVEQIEELNRGLQA
jgi:hypothetical protein